MAPGGPALPGYQTESQLAISRTITITTCIACIHELITGPGRPAGPERPNGPGAPIGPLSPGRPPIPGGPGFPKNKNHPENNVLIMAYMLLVRNEFAACLEFLLLQPRLEVQTVP